MGVSSLSAIFRSEEQGFDRKYEVNKFYDYNCKSEYENAYRRAMKTVVTWIQTNTQVFSRAFGPVHFRGGDWRSGGTFHNSYGDTA